MFCYLFKSQVGHSSNCVYLLSPVIAEIQIILVLFSTVVIVAIMTQPLQCQQIGEKACAKHFSMGSKVTNAYSLTTSPIPFIKLWHTVFKMSIESLLLFSGLLPHISNHMCQENDLVFVELILQSVRNINHVSIFYFLYKNIEFVSSLETLNSSPLLFSLLGSVWVSQLLLLHLRHISSILSSFRMWFSIVSAYFQRRSSLTAEP